MNNETLLALIGLAGTICTSLITAVLGPLVVHFVQRKASAPAMGSQAIAPQPVEIRVQGTEKPYQPVFAISSLALGVINLCGWLLPICGLPISILGLTFGVAGMNSSKRWMAIIGVVLCVIGLFAGIVNAGIGAYLGATGQHPLFR